MGGKNSFWRKPGGSTFGPTPKVAGFEMSPEVKAAEKKMLARQEAIASGSGPSIGQMQLNQNIDRTNSAAMAMAASQRGASNPMLAFRQAQIAGQEAQLQGAQEGAVMAEQERRQADQMIGAQAAAQRGVAMQQSNINQQAATNQRAQDKQMIAGLAGTGAKLAAMAHGGVVPGEANVAGDSYANDVIPAQLSPGEIVVPRSAVNSEKALKLFLEKIKIEEKLKKMEK